ncbi:hypothetical protein Cch02nite_58210 [Catellatospora chokoriensis]|uniref:Uncharacterized protein n=1 Tax=Catellatospora chokoriensis TaxID=310353 RepID=A0A8J3K4H0_9ACTN|nr:hypothetical protein Cch02nite_58210 [Catellatospora chokoriensis]
MTLLRGFLLEVTSWVGVVVGWDGAEFLPAVPAGGGQVEMGLLANPDWAGSAALGFLDSDGGDWNAILVRFVE